MAPKNNPWTAKLVKELGERYAKGESASAIARAFMDRYGLRFTRSAIIGKIHRSGFADLSPNSKGRLYNKSAAQMRAQAKKSARKNIAAAENKPTTSTSWWSAQRTMEKQPPTPVFTAASGRAYDAERIAAGLVSVVDRESHQCCWPIGDPRNESSIMCGAKVLAPGAPYCKHHYDRSVAEPVVMTPANDTRKPARTPEKV